MAKLKIVRQDGSVLEGEITPAVEYAFELHTKMGFHRAFRAGRKAIGCLLVSLGNNTQSR
jgi:hypothetical protein